MLETHPVANRTLLCLWQSRYDPAWTFGLVGPKYARLQKDSIAGTIRIFAHESLPMAKKTKGRDLTRPLTITQRHCWYMRSQRGR
ncbi:hypothetical protein AGR1B_Lc10271 [Agrobacterium fabacearum S56]|nr:hypothetical protein AGR1B_Lc10271 [Agrobacterium fabacearum S56]